MLIIPVKEGENIERAIKKYKKKFEKTKVMRELRERKEFIKPSVSKRQEKFVLLTSNECSLLKCKIETFLLENTLKELYGSFFFA